eukprot:3548006-Rhodomonas_salina.2
MYCNFEHQYKIAWYTNFGNSVHSGFRILQYWSYTRHYSSDALPRTLPRLVLQQGQTTHYWYNSISMNVSMDKALKTTFCLYNSRLLPVLKRTVRKSVSHVDNGSISIGTEISTALFYYCRIASCRGTVSRESMYPCVLTVFNYYSFTQKNYCMSQYCSCCEYYF